ncbi:hypothetical protein [Chitinophaga sp. 212800008-4]|uniref:hypothetical protein n=1 Tax=unclassified Chitinophaga TaxID=2619133 RepID=UPI0030D2D522
MKTTVNLLEPGQYGLEEMSIREMETVNGGETIGLEGIIATLTGSIEQAKYLAVTLINYLHFYIDVIFKSIHPL